MKLNTYIYLFIILNIVSNVFTTRDKLFAQYYPPELDIFGQTNHRWICDSVQNLINEIPRKCSVPGVYLVFSIIPTMNHGRIYRLPLKYVGRSTGNVWDRFKTHLDERTINENDMGCYMQFPTDPGFTNTNDVTPVEQQLLQAFASRVNSWDNQGFDRHRDFLHFDRNGKGYDIMRSLYTSTNIRDGINVFEFVNSPFPYPPAPSLAPLIPDQQVNHLIKDNEFNYIFNEGVPYQDGNIIVYEFDDNCIMNITFKKHSNGYLNRIDSLLSAIPAIDIYDLYQTIDITDENNPKEVSEELNGADIGDVTTEVSYYTGESIGYSNPNGDYGNGGPIGNGHSGPIGNGHSGSTGNVNGHGGSTGNGNGHSGSTGNVNGHSGSTGNGNGHSGPIGNGHSGSTGNGNGNGGPIGNKNCSSKCKDLRNSINIEKSKLQTCEANCFNLNSYYSRNFKLKSQCDKDYNDVLIPLRKCQKDYKYGLTDKTRCDGEYQNIITSLKKCQRDYSEEDNLLKKKEEQLKYCQNHPTRMYKNNINNTNN